MDIDPLCWFLFFCGQPVVVVLIIDSSKTRKSLVGVEVQSPYVIERPSKQQTCYLLIRPSSTQVYFKENAWYHGTEKIITRGP